MRRLSRQEGLFAGAWLGLASWATALRALQVPFERPSFTFCAFRALTGWPCPGCGMGRSLLMAFQGRWRESLQMHALGLPLFAFWSLWMLHGAVNAARGRPFSGGFREPRRSVAFAALAAILGAYALRLSA